MKMETMLRALCCIAFLVLLACIPRRSAQDSSCLNKLSPCLNYLNGTEDPPDSCCEPLKSVIESDAECLCNLAQGAKQNKLALISMRLSNFLVDVANMLIHCLASQCSEIWYETNDYEFLKDLDYHMLVT
ncbi:Lipid transfer-like protein VAS [Glycine soja]